LLSVYADSTDKFQSFDLNGYRVKADPSDLSIAEMAGFTVDEKRIIK
jgi:hypothetical protein